MDIAAALTDTIVLAPLQRCVIPTGFALALPQDYEAQVRPRSGLALRRGLTILNAPGTIDADYREEVKVLLINLGDKPVEVKRGDRIAQLIIAPVARVPVGRKSIGSAPPSVTAGSVIPGRQPARTVDSGLRCGRFSL